MINGTNDRGLAISFTASATDFPLLRSVQVCYGVHPANEPTLPISPPCQWAHQFTGYKGLFPRE